jgi:glycine C-acetyltransferase
MRLSRIGLNHASIIDGVRLCKGRYRYENSNMEDLEQQLIKANKAGSRFKIIVTDGVFYGRSCTPLDKICDFSR